MAVFRSDQSQLTYAMESAPGGDVELNNGTRTSSGYAARINGAVALGSSQIVVDTKTGANLVIGDFIRISDTLADDADAAASTVAPYEIRRVLHATALDGSGTLFLDRPVGFAHIDNGYVHEVTAVESTTGQQKIITYNETKIDEITGEEIKVEKKVENIKKAVTMEETSDQLSQKSKDLFDELFGDK